MADYATSPAPVEGRRRADFPVGQTVAATPADPWDETAQAPRPMLNDALEFVDDRLDRLEHVLGDLNGVVMRAGAQLEPILTGGTYTELDRPADPGGPSPEDNRSTIARKVAGKGQRLDRLADAAVAIRIRLEAILDASEV